MATGTAAIVTAKPKDVTGGMWVGDLGIAIPLPDTNPFGALDPGFDSAGIVGPEGFQKNTAATDTDEGSWSGIVVNTVREDYAVSYTTTLRETANATVLRRVFGESNVIESAPDASTGNITLTVLSTPDTAPRQSVVFEMLDKGLGHREVIENAQVLSQGEQSYTHGASVTIPVTIKAYPGTTQINGKTVNAFNMKETAPAAA